MSKQQSRRPKDSRVKPKVVKTSATRTSRSESKTTTAQRSKPQANPENLIFKKENYYIMIGGLILILIGFVLMSGGSMPDPDTWDPNIIYSARRTVVAPIFILAGLIVEIYAIFFKK